MWLNTPSRCTRFPPRQPGSAQHAVFIDAPSHRPARPKAPAEPTGDARAHETPPDAPATRPAGRAAASPSQSPSTRTTARRSYLPHGLGPEPNIYMAVLLAKGAARRTQGGPRAVRPRPRSRHKVPGQFPKPGRIVGALDGPIATHCAPGRRGSNGARYLNVGSCSSAISIPPDSRRTVQNAPPCTTNSDQLEGFARSRTTLAVALKHWGDHLLRARCARYHLGVFRSRASRRKFRPLHDPTAPKAAHAMDDAERANTRLGIELMPRFQPERSYEASGALHPARRLRAHQDADALRWRAERGSARVTEGP